ncbi:hypothetical protein [Streptomyces xanthophaeus]|uniref:hypothetical protein n=1 Tax=Streptomyces xanthophaeus TaxID=67385 RepID=UPI00365AA286
MSARDELLHFIGEDTIQINRLIDRVVAEEGSARPAVPGLDPRALQLADHILDTGGEWTTSKAHKWVTKEIAPKPPIHFTRHSLQALVAHGYLRARHEPGRISYLPNYPKQEG